MDIDIEGKFLSFSWWLLHKGWKRLAERVEAAVQEVFGRYDTYAFTFHLHCFETFINNILSFFALKQYAVEACN
jgi:hypothetical protein